MSVQSRQENFSTVPLHDATLVSVHLEWKEARCTLEVVTHDGPCKLVFVDVSSVSIPKTQPWGPSSSINCQRVTDDDSFEIEIQSGDMISIRAAGYLMDGR